MIIKRVVDGKEMEFELTVSELIQAHEEHQLDCAVDDVISICEENEYDMTLSDEQLKEVAKLALRNLSKNDGYYESYWMSFEYTLEEYIDDIKNKEEI
jgi:hypothetical protein